MKEMCINCCVHWQMGEQPWLFCPNCFGVLDEYDGRAIYVVFGCDWERA